MGNAQAAARESECARALDEQNAEEELSAEKRHSIQHTHTHTHSEKFKGTVCSGLDS